MTKMTSSSSSVRIRTSSKNNLIIFAMMMKPRQSFEKQSRSLNSNCRQRFKLEPPPPTSSQFQFYQKVSHVKLEYNVQPKNGPAIEKLSFIEINLNCHHRFKLLTSNLIFRHQSAAFKGHSKGWSKYIEKIHQTSLPLL